MTTATLQLLRQMRIACGCFIASTQHVDGGVRKRSARGCERDGKCHGQLNSLDSAVEGESISDDKTKTGGQDRSRISLSEDYEVRDWTKKFGVTAEVLKLAVHAVGSDAQAVETYLKPPVRRCALPPGTPQPHPPQRLRLLVGWLARTQPDVVALQEFKCPTAQFLRA